MHYQHILLQQLEDGIYQLTINRPDRLNALNRATLEEIEQSAVLLHDLEQARVLLITGAGDKAFVAGADIAEMESMNALQAREFSQLGQRAMRAIETLQMPVIAVVNGYCLGGGCELALCCDWIVAAEQAIFGQPEVKLGVLPGFGGSQRLARAIGRARAMELITTARQLDARQALDWGLANHVYEQSDLHQQALASAREIAGMGPVGVQLAKEAVLRGQDIDQQAGCYLESELFALSFASEDQHEGMSAFLQKRTPQFRGR